MPALFVFLFKVNIALLLFCAGYYLVLRHLTFYTLNRAYLMVAIVFATLYPKIDLSDFAMRHETIAKPVQTVVLNWQAPAEKLIKPLTQPNYWQWATVIFWAGAVFLAFRLLMQLFSLFQLYRRSQPARIHDHDVRLIEGEAAPFSFWRSIYVNPANHTPADLQAILLHEQVHVNGWHTIDILLAELSSIFYWFNPGIWLMKKAVRENIEFITDRKILNKGFDTKTYQYSLVNVSFNATTPGIVNHFNISTIKKRIIMMNAKRSSRFKLTRYAFVVPAVVALLLVFTLSKAEIAKPITHKIAVAIKPVTLAITEAAQNAMAFTDTAPAKKTKPVTAKAVKADTTKFKQIFNFVYNTKVDTGKKQKLYIRTSNSHTIDSMNIVLNGKKVPNSIFSKVDPGTIESINIINAGDLKLNSIDGYTFNNDKDIIFIATKDSDEGKALADKLGKRRQVTNIRINGVNKDMDKLTLQEGALVRSLPGLQGEVRNVIITGRANASTIAGDEVREVVLDSGFVRVNGHPTGRVAGVQYKTDKAGWTTISSTAMPANVVVNTNVATFGGTGVYKEDVVVAGYPTKNSNQEVVVTGYGTKNNNKDVVVTGYRTKSDNNNKDVVVTGYATKNDNRGLYRVKTDNVVYVTGQPAVTTTLRLNNMDRISDKLIVIDGKIASEKELKKLSAFDIDRMATSNSADTVKKYGDKAKYGVVYIYTKKGK
jgi:bla regulator protein BlaR1